MLSHLACFHSDFGSKSQAEVEGRPKLVLDASCWQLGIQNEMPRILQLLSDIWEQLMHSVCYESFFPCFYNLVYDLGRRILTVQLWAHCIGHFFYCIGTWHAKIMNVFAKKLTEWLESGRRSSVQLVYRTFMPSSSRRRTISEVVIINFAHVSALGIYPQIPAT